MTDIAMRPAILRAIRGLCPCCGKGQLFSRYLKQVPNCAACGESFSQFRADDAAPWLTIIVIGHVFLPLAFMIDTSALPLWGVTGGMAAIFAGLGAVLLPRAKGTILAILWATRANANPEFEAA